MDLHRSEFYGRFSKCKLRYFISYLAFLYKFCSSKSEKIQGIKLIIKKGTV